MSQRELLRCARGLLTLSDTFRLQRLPHWSSRGRNSPVTSRDSPVNHSAMLEGEADVIVGWNKGMVAMSTALQHHSSKSKQGNP
jgi:hypothetical protein